MDTLIIKLKRKIRIWKNSYHSQKKIKKYKGNKVTCPICGSSFKKFAPFGVILRENAQCHTCGSLERHRLLWKYLHEKTNLLNSQQQLKLLHFAPERSFYEVFSENLNIDYTPCDISPEIFTFANKVEIKKADITNLQFENDTFDVILCNHVLEHIPDDQKAMKELYRVMKKGGWGIFQVPLAWKNNKTYEDSSITSPEEREKAFGQNDHVRIYGKDYTERLQNVGFKVKVDDYVTHLTKEQQFKFGLERDEPIYLCIK